MGVRRDRQRVQERAERSKTQNSAGQSIPCQRADRRPREGPPIPAGRERKRKKHAELRLVTQETKKKTAQYRPFLQVKKHKTDDGGCQEAVLA